MDAGYDGYMPAGLQQQQPPQQTPYRQQPTGARLKVMRCLQLKAPESKRALLDFGMGVGVDLDRQVRPAGVCTGLCTALHRVTCLCMQVGLRQPRPAHKPQARCAVADRSPQPCPNITVPLLLSVSLSHNRSCMVSRASRLLTC
jgi:hypothetical protein